MPGGAYCLGYGGCPAPTGLLWPCGLSSHHHLIGSIWTCKNSNLVILLTEWDEFKSIDFKKIIKNKRIKVFDLRNLYNAEEMKKRKIEYYSIGRPNTN